jgi:TetR/AcrR family transcriptional repressor of nem operon
MMQEATTRSHLLIGLGGEPKGEHTRQEIIRKAAPIFNQRGYDGAALSDLMKATGLEKGGIYRHVDSKEELAAEAFDYACEETLHARIHDLDGITNTVDRLKQLLASSRRAVALEGSNVRYMASLA